MTHDSAREVIARAVIALPFETRWEVADAVLAELQSAGYAVVPVETLRAVKVALENLVEEKCDYMRLNHLGDPEVQHTVKYGRAALAMLTASDSGQEKQNND